MQKTFEVEKNFYINIQAICEHQCNFINIEARWPGSTHDGNFCAKFERQEINGILLGDNGHPLRQYLITTLLR